MAPDRTERQKAATVATLRGRGSRQFWRDYQWQVIVTLLVASLGLGYVGFAKYGIATGQPLSPLDTLYRTLQLAVFESGAVAGPVSLELEVARWLVPATVAYTAVLAAASLFRRQLQMIRLRYLRGHVIICGLGEKGFRLAESLWAAGHRVVAIDLGEDNSHVAACWDRGSIVLTGDATDHVVLRKAAVRRASHLIAVCGEDGVNAEVAAAARQAVVHRTRGPLTCAIHLLDPRLCELLRELELEGAGLSVFRLELFNIYDRGARVLLDSYPPPVSDSPGSPHFLVVGLGPLGESLVMHAARDWHQRPIGNGPTMRISVVDEHATVKVRALTRRYPKLAARCELIPLEMKTDELALDDADFLPGGPGVRNVEQVYVCLEDSMKGLRAALRLRDRLGSDEPSIMVRMPENVGLSTLLFGPDVSAGTGCGNIHPFGLLERICTPDLVLGGTHELLARGFHEAYLVEHSQGSEARSRDRAQVPWEDLPEDLKEANRRQVDRVSDEVRAAGYRIRPLTDWDAGRQCFQPQEIELMARFEHTVWMEDLLRQGWRRAVRKDAARKSHPYLVPWEALPEEARDINRQAVAALPALLARAGFQVYVPGS